MAEQEGLTVKKSNDFSEWYTQIVQKAELADIRYNVKGFVVFRPWAVKTMNNMFKVLEDELEAKGHVPALFPALIPESNFKKESEHVEGFLPEVFWVTKVGSDVEKLEEPLAMRPTSETAIYKMYSMWIRSWRDLPLKIYQRCQVWRYEGKATRPFIRGREFYWIESHDAFGTEKEALQQVKEDMKITENTLYKKFGIPFIFFQRPEHDKFAGAVHTYAADTIMPDGRVLQLPSTHLLGQNFSKPFDVKFIDDDKKEKYVWQTCYGPAVSRIFAAVIGFHGDDKGLVLPPEIAAVQIVIVPILKDGDTKVMKKVDDLYKKLKDKFSVTIDSRKEYTPGWKYNYWELKGVPLRIEIGPKDVKNKQMVLVRRDTGEKIIAKETDVKKVESMLKSIQNNLILKADKYFKKNICEIKKFDELKNVLEKKGGLIKIEWCGRKDCADDMKEKTNGGVIRGKIFDKEEKPKSTCINCNNKSKEVVYISKQY
ncbi:MAG: proline--tRNA ligase [Candidatus Aenigmarchaeota archaeon]|nr:proline--tRNA ligase [Candidatus Aenigmarchaeota archaeon]